MSDFFPVSEEAVRCRQAHQLCAPDVRPGRCTACNTLREATILAAYDLAGIVCHGRLCAGCYQLLKRRGLLVQALL